MNVTVCVSSLVTIYSRILPAVTNYSIKRFVENQRARFNPNTFFSADFDVYEIMWKNMVKTDGPYRAIRRMRFACWITKATGTHRE